MQVIAGFTMRRWSLRVATTTWWSTIHYWSAYLLKDIIIYYAGRNHPSAGTTLSPSFGIILCIAQIPDNASDFRLHEQGGSDIEAQGEGGG